MLIGIDLGTTFCSVAYLDEKGRTVLVPDAEDRNTYVTPSLALFDELGPLVGNLAEDRLGTSPELQSIRFVKLSMGDEQTYIDDAGAIWTPEGISALLLKKLMTDAWTEIAHDIEGAVIAVPATFTHQQRLATCWAAELCGLSTVGLVDEPVAAAVYHGQFSENVDKTILVFDFGGGTFDATILHASTGTLQVVATEGDPALGGRNVEDLIIEDACESIRASLGVDLEGEPGMGSRLRKMATELKLNLSRTPAASTSHAFFVGSRPVEYRLDRTRFEALLSPLVERTLAITTRCMETAGLGWSDVNVILMTGGSSLLPNIRDKLAALGGRQSADILIDSQPQYSVALGAALVAAMTDQDRSSVADIRRLIPAAPHDLCLKVQRGGAKPELHVLIHRATPLPARSAQTIYTRSVDQTYVTIELAERRLDTDGCETTVALERFSFGPLPNPSPNCTLQLDICYETNGVISVVVTEPDSGKTLRELIGTSPTHMPGRIAAQKELLMKMQSRQ